MHLRLTMLLLVAAASGAAAGVLSEGATSTASAASPPRAPRPQSRADVPRCPIPPGFRRAFEAASADAVLPVAMLVAVGEVESSMRHDAVSAAGARGLLQVMPATARELALDADRPATNVLAGARYLRAMLDRFGSTDLALAAYNAGPTAVERAGGAPSAAVATYVADVTARWRTLAGCS